MYEVTQADRDAAADAVKAYRDNKNGDWQARIRNGECDDGYMVQAFARHRSNRTDATPVAVEMVAELQLSAFLAGRGSIRTKANGNTHESAPGPTMDDYRRMARFALAEGQVDATPVAWMPIESAPKGVPTEDVGCRGESEWFLGKPSGKYPQSAPFIVICRRAWPQDASWKDAGDTHYRPDYFSEWCPIETSHPPATDVAALVEALQEVISATGAYLPPDGISEQECIGRVLGATDNPKIIAALAPFTKDQP